MKSVAVKAQNIVLLAAEPSFPGERVSVQKERAFRRLRLHQVPAGDSKLHNAWNGRAGFPTLETLQQQAELVGLRRDSRTHAARLRGLQEILYERYGTRDHPDIQALEEAIRQLSPGIHTRQ